MKPVFKCLILFVFALFLTINCQAFSVFAHEAIVDASWAKSILPLLKKKYPQATDEELKAAHSYCYGGSLVADMGYFPLGNEYFTNLLHYVRSGDFVGNLLSEAQNLNEYAFAIGALSHYYADEYGHSMATNHAVPILFPKLGKQFGSLVNYEEDPRAHSRTEFAFDVLQSARGNYASQAYHDFIGFNVARPVLERAFLKTYGEDLNDIFGDLSLTIGTFRWTMKNILPGLTKAAWSLKKNEIMQTNPAANYKSFHYRIKKKEYYKDFGKDRQRLSLRNKISGFLLALLPKIGALKTYKFKDPGPEGEKLFIASFDTILLHYGKTLDELQYRDVTLRNIDFDTGKNTVMGEYGLTDETYGDLVISLKEKNFNDLSGSLKENIVSFYNAADTNKFARKDPKDWKKAHSAIQQVRLIKPIPVDSLKTTTGLYYKFITAKTDSLKQ